MLRAATLGLMFAASLGASTVVFDSLQLSYVVPGIGPSEVGTLSNGQSFSGTGNSLSTGPFNAGGWAGSVKLLTNIGDGQDFDFPLSVGISQTNLQCRQRNCSPLELDFTADFVIEDPTPEFGNNSPFRVVLDGTGPDLLFHINIETADGFMIDSGNVPSPGSEYDFLHTGTLNPGNFTLSNFTVQISGFLRIPNGGAANTTLSLPDSFRIDLETQPSNVPEPSRLPLIAGGLTVLLAGWVSHKRRSARLQ